MKIELIDKTKAKVEIINTIKHLYPDIRQNSKGATFACVYGGTFLTLHRNLGLPIPQAKNIENRYKKLYKVSIDYTNDKLIEATKTGYVTLAFGHKLRTPLLNQVVLNNSKTPLRASREGRTAGNALGQSYGLLTNRALSEFMRIVRKSKHRLDIRPTSLIHDAIYLIIKNDPEVIKFVNDNLIKCMEYQEGPIFHEQVKLKANLDIFYPDWSNSITLPNNISESEIENIIVSKLAEFLEKITNEPINK